MNLQKTAVKKYVHVRKEEYMKLKQLQRYFGAFLNYFEHTRSIANAREDIKTKRVISQEKLFKKLGI